MHTAGKRETAIWTEELAKRLAAGYLSWQLDIPFQSAYKRYVEHAAIGDYWLGLAGAIVANPPGRSDIGAGGANTERRTGKRPARVRSAPCDQTAIRRSEE